jgi:hypothetical protein
VESCPCADIDAAIQGAPGKWARVLGDRAAFGHWSASAIVMIVTDAHLTSSTHYVGF